MANTLYEELPADWGTTPCEYFAKCTTETNKIMPTPFGPIPICDSCLNFYQTH